jgi:hypothetical protein
MLSPPFFTRIDDHFQSAEFDDHHLNLTIGENLFPSLNMKAMAAVWCIIDEVELVQET